MGPEGSLSVVFEATRPGIRFKLFMELITYSSPEWGVEDLRMLHRL